MAWTITRDERGFWCEAGAVRVGPYPRKNMAQDFAARNIAPRPPEPPRPRRKVDEDVDA